MIELRKEGKYYWGVNKVKERTEGR